MWIFTKHGFFSAVCANQNMRLKNLEKEIEAYKGDAGFELIAQRLGVPRSVKRRGTVSLEDQVQ